MRSLNREANNHQGLQPQTTDMTQKEKLQKINSGTFLYLFSKLVRVKGL